MGAWGVLGQFWKLKLLVRWEGWSSFHVQAKPESKIFGGKFSISSEISNFWWGGQSYFMSRQNLKFKNYGQGERSVIFPCPGKIWNLKFMVGGLVIFACPGWIQNLKFSGRMGGVSHLLMSRPNLKFKNVQWELGVQVKKIWNLKLLVRVGLVISPYPVQIPKFKNYSEGVGVRFYVKSEI